VDSVLDDALEPQDEVELVVPSSRAALALGVQKLFERAELQRTGGRRALD
jgi:hypothetical protein